MSENLRTRGRGLLAQKREARAWYWRLHGLSWNATAAQLAKEGLGKGPDCRTPVSRSAVQCMIARVRARLQFDTREETDRQIEALNLIIGESLDAWDRSKEDFKRIMEKTVAAESPPLPASGAIPTLPPTRPGRKESVMEVEQQCGDVRYLEQARRALADIRSILGIKASEKLDATSGGKPVAVIRYEVIQPGLPGQPEPAALTG